MADRTEPAVADRTAETDTSRPDVSIVMVGLNARNYVRGSLASMQAADWTGCRYEVVYVDNGSKDGTVQMIADEFPSVVVIANATNLGFCRAANQGAAKATGRYFYFINDDTLVRDRAISLLVGYMDAHPEVGTVGSRLVYPDGQEQFSGRRFPGLINGIWGRRSLLTRLFPGMPWVRDYLYADRLAGQDAFEVDWVSAAGQIVRRDLFQRIGGFAEDYYYWHEAVFCDRLRAVGGAVRLHPGSIIVHYEGQGSGTRRTFKAQRFHVIDFHSGAYRCYCEHYRLGRFHPARWMAAITLGGRAACLLALAGVRTGLHRLTSAGSAA